MGKGKIAAQCSHATLGLYKKLVRRAPKSLNRYCNSLLLDFSMEGISIFVSQFMDDLSAEEDVLCNHSDNAFVPQINLNKDPSLRSVLSDPLSGAFLEDAMVVSCGHSFGGLMLRRVVESSRCTLCNPEIETRSLVPNLALRAAAAAVKHEDDRRLFHNANILKRREEFGDQTDPSR